MFSLNKMDFLKGLLTAAIMAVVATSGQMLEEWAKSPTFHIEKVDIILSLKAAMGGMVAYLIKNFLTPQQTVVKGDVKIEP